MRPEQDDRGQAPRLIGAIIRGLPTGPRTAWALLGSVGLAFTLTTLVDLALLAIPAHPADGQWVFNVVPAALEGVPLLLVGLVLGYAGAYTRERAGALRGWSLLAIVIALLLLVAFGAFLVHLPGILTGAGQDSVRRELVRTILGSCTKGIAYPAALLWLGIRGWSQAART